MSNTLLAPTVAKNSRNNYLQILDDAWEQHLAPKAADAPKVISLFAGAGGSSLGYSMAGYQERLAVEWDDNAVATFRLNFSAVPVYHGDIAKVSVEECLKLSGLTVGELDVLDGSPPCQGFSTAGKRIMDDPRNLLFREYVRLLRGLQPKVLIMENVSGMVKGKMKLIFAEILRELKASGYQVRAWLMNAMYFNVPQSRQRIIFIGVRNDLRIVPIELKPESKPVGVKYTYSDDGTRFTGTNLERWQLIPPGKNWEYLPNHLRDSGKFSNNWRKLHPDNPFFTFIKTPNFTSGIFLHWTDPRHISLCELKRVFSYPDDFEFIGTDRNIYNRIGNSVPPLFIRSIARHVRKTILELSE